MPNWTLVDKTTIVTPTVQPPTKARTLNLFRQSAQEHDGPTLEVDVVPATDITVDLRNHLRLGVIDAVDRTRRCLVALTGGTEILGQIDTLTSKIDHDKAVTKTDLYPILYGHSFAALKSKQKSALLTRFFGTKAGQILDGIDTTYDTVKKEYKTSVTPSYVFRTVLGTMIIGLNLPTQGLVLADHQGALGDSITNWSAWKAAIPQPGLTGFTADGILASLGKGMASMEDGVLRVNVNFLKSPDGVMERFHYPGGVFRNSNMFALTYIHEASHLFAATSDSYYFQQPWEADGIEDGADNPHNELDNGKPTTERCLMNADSYAWLIYQLGDSRFSG
jgi:hypothetical protein